MFFHVPFKNIINTKFCYSKFIQDKYEYPKSTSAYMAGAVYDVSMIISPFLGGIIVCNKLID